MQNKKLPWILLGVVIVAAVALQIFTYANYNKLHNGVTTFTQAIQLANNDKDLEVAAQMFATDIQPIISTSKSQAFLGIGKVGRIIKNGFGKIFGGGNNNPSGTPTTTGVSNDAIKRCLELGGSEEFCNKNFNPLSE